MTDKNNTSFDFDYWMNLAKENPSAFNEHRKKEVKALIESAPENMQRRLYGLQWRIDMEINLGKNPMDSFVRIYRMMLDSIYGENGLLEALTQVSKNTETLLAKEQPGDKIVDISAHKLGNSNRAKNDSIKK